MVSFQIPGNLAFSTLVSFESLCSFSRLSISYSSIVSNQLIQIILEHFHNSRLTCKSHIYTEFITRAGDIRFRNLLNNNPAALNKRSTAADDNGMAKTILALLAMETDVYFSSNLIVAKLVAVIFKIWCLHPQGICSSWGQRSL